MIKLICVGKIKEKYLTDGVNDYFKRINKYHKFEIIEVDDSIPSIEETKIMKHIDNKDYVITLEIEGKNLSSTQFADKLDNTFISHSNITFVIGGSYGLSNNIKNRSNYKDALKLLIMRHIINRILFLIIKDVNRVLTLFFLLIKVHYYDKIFVVEEAVYVL